MGVSSSIFVTFFNPDRAACWCVLKGENRRNSGKGTLRFFPLFIFPGVLLCLLKLGAPAVELGAQFVFAGQD